MTASLRQTLRVAICAIAMASAGAVAACDAGDESSSAPGSTKKRGRSGIKLVRQSVRPQPSPASRYGAKVDHTPSAVEAALIEGLRGGQLVHEVAVSAMTRELARTAPDHLNMPPALVDGLLAWFGLVDPPPRLVVVEIPSDSYGCDEKVDGPCGDAIGALLDEVRKTADVDAGARFGVGVVGLENGNTRMMVCIVNRMVELEEMAGTLQVGDSMPLKGRMMGGRSNPRLEVIGPKGKWQTVPTVTSNDGTFQGTVRCDRGRGIYQVELLVTGAHGPEVAVNFPLYCGAARSPEIDYEIELVDDGVTASDVARSNFDYLNEARVARGLEPIAWDAEAAKIALAHSEDMERSGFVGHVSPTTGDVTQRFARAKLQGVVIRENVARGYGPKGMHESLMNSPGHRVNILAEDITHVGIGVVIADPETNAAGAPRPMFLTQNFYKKRGDGPKDLPGATRKQVDEKRDAAGLSAIKWDDRLSKIAQKRADALSKGRAGPSDEELQAAVFGLSYGSLAQHRVSSGDHGALSTVDVWLSLGDAQHVGLGVARVADKKTGAVGFVLIMLVAEG